MSYKLKFIPVALKEWNKLDNSIKIQFKKKLKELLENPKIQSSKLIGYKNLYKIKLKATGYRLVYEVIESEIYILVIAIGKRDKNFYKKFENLTNDLQRTTPLGLIIYAKHYLDASLVVYDNISQNKISIPSIYLIAHSIELSLKAFLLYKGIELNTLKRKYSHNLKKCLRKSKSIGLINIVKIEKIEENTLEILNNIYSKKELNYIVKGYKKYPNFKYLKSLSKKLLLKISNEIGYNSDNF